MQKAEKDMGVCASSQKTKAGKVKGVRGGGGAEAGNCIKLLSSSTTTKVIHVDGWLQEFKQPVQAKAVTSDNRNCFLCNSESLSVGTCAPHVPDEEELRPDHIYFLMPLSRAHHPFSLADMCALAIKASSALGNNGVDLSSISSNFIFR